MITYRIFYWGLEIGLLEINEQGQHRYTPIPETTQQLSLAPFRVLETGQDWGPPIPLLQNRINNARRFHTEQDITSVTDHFRLLMAEGGADA
ncbi:MAG: hypothetical protein LUC87_04670 [Clostridiales bacterium]|nr:hypothetical protein [Clostridiales bacterium]MCD8366727.1 hypothetical protein [Clostridiales bacterium]